jgi:iodotyrosine deiodinase
MHGDGFVPLEYTPISAEESAERSRQFFELCSRRRTVRDYSDADVSREVIEHCVRTARTAPSGANQQPWHFVLIQDPTVKQQIRTAAETEEREFYQNRAPDEWLRALEPFGTNADKPFLEVAPWLIAVFCQRYRVAPDGLKTRHYYATESVGIATGLLITAIHNAGLCSLTHTPSPMGFLNQVLGRPENERPCVLLAVGYPANDIHVPDIQRKNLSEIATWY